MTHPHCIDIVRALSQVYEKSGLEASLITDEDAHTLPHVSMPSFTEPDGRHTEARYLRTRVIGICKPTEDANVVLLADATSLELPQDAFRYTIEELVDRVLRGSAQFIGFAELVKKGTYRAKHGGDLIAQQTF